MKRNKRGNLIELIFALLLLPLLVYWKEVVTIGVITLIGFIIYKIIKVICIANENNIYEVKDIIIEDIDPLTPEQEYDEYMKDKNVIKGIEAEEKIITILNKVFDRKNIIHDAYFVDKELVTTQIDIIVVDTSGIYIIESKTYSSIIKGNVKEREWVQLFSGKKYQRFSNPIIQNKRHVNAIKENLKSYELSDSVFKSYIVFEDKCNLEIEQMEYVKEQQKELFYAMLQDKNTSSKLIPEEKVEEISRRLKAHANVDKKTKMEHIRRRKDKVKY